MTSPTVPRVTKKARVLNPTVVRGGNIPDRGQVGLFDAADLPALLAAGQVELVPDNASVDFEAQLLPEELAPPPPVQLRWVGGVSSRLIDGVSRHLGDLFSTDPATAAALIEDRVAERVDA